MDDQVLFTADAPGWSEGREYKLKSANDAAGALAAVHDLCALREFDYLPVKKNDVQALANKLVKQGEGMSGLSRALAARKPSEIAPALSSACLDWPRPERTKEGTPPVKTAAQPLAESLFLYYLFSRAGVALTPLATVKFNKAPAGKQEVVFVGKLGVAAGSPEDWFAVKKLTVDEKTPTQETALILASIDATAVRKMFEFALDEATRERLDAVAQRAAQGKRRTLSNVAKILDALTPDLKAASGKPAEHAFLLFTALNTAGIRLSPSPEMLQEVFPEMKIPKPKGNFGKKKKKK